MECIDFVVMVLPRQKKRKRREAEKASWRRRQSAWKQHTGYCSRCWSRYF
jgi:hypothetical protein